MEQLRARGVLLALAVLAAALTHAGAQEAAGLTRLPSLLAAPTASSATEVCRALAGAGAALCGLWLALVCVLAALDHLSGRRGRAPRHRPAILRPRLVQALAGATLACAGTHPAVAAHADTDHRGAGAALPLPVRPVTPAPARTGTAPATVPSTTVLVRPGDDLWSIAAELLSPSIPDSGIDRAWRVIYAHNRSRIGDDPDLLHPGTTLTVPDLGPASTTPPTRSRQP